MKPSATATSTINMWTVHNGTSSGNNDRLATSVGATANLISAMGTAENQLQ